MPNGTISGVSKAKERVSWESRERLFLTMGGLEVVSRYLHLLVRCHPLASKVAVFLEGCKWVVSNISIPMLATL